MPRAFPHAQELLATGEAGADMSPTAACANDARLPLELDTPLALAGAPAATREAKARQAGAPRKRYIAEDDPRRLPRVTERDLRALLFIGRGYEVAQYQLHEAVFTGLAEGIMSRWTRRMLDRGVIAVERWGKVGINRLRLTKAGRDLLIEHRAKVDDVFTPRSATALKDVQHTLWINDLRVALPRLPVPPDVVAPAWLLQRRLTAATTVVPDLLAIRTPRSNECGYVLAAEIDLGGERLKTVFVPKLARLCEEVTGWSSGAPAIVLVLTRGPRRREALAAAARDFTTATAVLVELLPVETGRAGLKQLTRQLEGAAGPRAAAT